MSSIDIKSMSDRSKLWYEWLKQFRGYPEWSTDTQDQARYRLIEEYYLYENLDLQRALRGRTPTEEMIDMLKHAIEWDLIHLEAVDEFEICAILRDTLKEL